VSYLPGVAALVAVIVFAAVVVDHVHKQHEMFCQMAADYIVSDTGVSGYERALASWRKFQIEDGCLR
jgi:hypothetical protein